MKTKDEIIEYLRREGISGVFTKRLDRLFGQFATLDAFFAASRGEILKEFAKVSKSANGVSDRFWAVFDQALRYYKFGDPDEEVATPAAEPVEELKPQVDQRCVRLISRDELKTIVDFMDLCGVEAINLLEVTGFLSAVKMRQQKPAEEDTHEEKEDGKQPE